MSNPNVAKHVSPVVLASLDLLESTGRILQAESERLTQTVNWDFNLARMSRAEKNEQLAIPKLIDRLANQAIRARFNFEDKLGRLVAREEDWIEEDQHGNLIAFAPPDNPPLKLNPFPLGEDEEEYDD